MKKVLILGSTGLIGHQIYFYLERTKKYELYNLANTRKINRSTLNINALDEQKLTETIYKINPDIIVNCIGLLISGSSANPKNAIFLNSYLPHFLHDISERKGGKLIHISTDCVFSGNKNTPYDEYDDKDGKDVYGKTKGLGEIISDNHLTLRTSVVGPEIKTNGEELFHWFMQQENKISGYTKSVWSGVTTLELARAVDTAIDKDIVGLHHVTNNQAISKYDLLQLFKKYMKKNIEIIPVDGVVTNKSFIDTRQLFGYNIPNYEDMISDMAEFILKNSDLYKQYFKLP